jgi:signal transduction histidine kinase
VPARLTARARLAALHTAMVTGAALALTALTYLLMRENLHRKVTILTLTGPPDPAAPPPPVPTDLGEQVEAVALTSFATQAGLALVVVTALAAVTSWVVAGRVLRPVRTITATAERLSAEDLSERVPVPAPPDELAALASTLNGMLDRVQRGLADRDRVLAGQRMFTANAAHELRTPLATMRTALDVTLDGSPDRVELLAMAHDVRTAAEQCQRTLDGLLVLARSHAGPREPVATDLAEITRRVLDGAAADGPELRADLRPGPVDGEPVLLERLVANLVDNALRYNAPGGWVEVSTHDGAGGAVLRVVNTGPPVDPGNAVALVEPFVRAEGSRTGAARGTGLGLSIVRAVTEAHHGRLELVARRGGGLEVTVYLPAGPVVVREKYR